MLERGMARRQTASNVNDFAQQNHNSSRSHAFLTLTIKRLQLAGQQVIKTEATTIYLTTYCVLLTTYYLAYLLLSLFTTYYYLQVIKTEATTISLVDLAGSEKFGKEGKRIGARINYLLLLTTTHYLLTTCYLLLTTYYLLLTTYYLLLTTCYLLPTTYY